MDAAAKEMILGLLGRKLRMTQIFDEDGTVIPVTAIEVGPCYVVGIRTVKRDGYRALQLGFGVKKAKRLKKPQRVYYEKIGVPPVAFVREVPYGADALLEQVQLGTKLSVDVLEGTELVDVTGISKGRGFSGCIKRHGFRRGPMTHGCKNIRDPGSTGCSAFPSKTIKGKRMPGHYGAEKVTVRNLKVLKILPEDNLLLVKGSIPGPSGGYVVIRKSIFERNKWGLSSGKRVG